MSAFVYTPDPDVKVHGEGAIRLICKPFQSHEAGLPEWLKNASDEYARSNAAEEKRVVVIVLQNAKRGQDASISVVDFCGMTSTVIERNFRHWADPEAAIREGANRQIQGGHGNGGKCYMTQMFDKYALIHTVKKGRGCRYGVIAGSYRFGYIPKATEGRDFAVPDPIRELTHALADVNVDLAGLPDAAQNALRLADGFTLVKGSGPKGYRRIPTPQILDNLREHPQMIQTLELCKVFLVVDGELTNNGQPLTLPEIPPIDGAEQPRVLQVPDKLVDPHTEEEVPTTKDGTYQPGTLVLRTASSSMRYHKKLRHNIIFKAASGYIGYVAILALDIQSPFRDKIYGECHLEALENFKQNERGPLARAPCCNASWHPRLSKSSKMTA